MYRSNSFISLFSRSMVLMCCVLCLLLLGSFNLAAAQSLQENSSIQVYDPRPIWTDYIKTQIPEGTIIRQKVYSRGNDEGGKKEGSYETARMYVQLVAIPENVELRSYKLRLEVWATISTPEAKHARDVFPFWLRIGGYTKDKQNGAEYLRPIPGNLANFFYPDREFSSAIQGGKELDSRGRWIVARVDLGNYTVGGPDGSRLGFIQSVDRASNKFSSNYEYDKSVKHKVKAVYGTVRNKLALYIALEQPRTLHSERLLTDLDQFLRDLGTFEYRDGKWSQRAGAVAPPFDLR